MALDQAALSFADPAKYLGWSGRILIRALVRPFEKHRAPASSVAVSQLALSVNCDWPCHCIGQMPARHKIGVQRSFAN